MRGNRWSLLLRRVVRDSTNAVAFLDRELPAGQPSFGTGRSPFSIASSSLIASLKILICS